MGVEKIRGEFGEPTNFESIGCILGRTEVPIGAEKETKSRSIELTDRDFELMRFILEMKFASGELLFQRFFKVTLSKHESRSRAWSQRRLQQLEKSNLIRGAHSFSERVRYFTCTKNGYYAIRQVYPQDHHVRPCVELDQRSFYHDKTIVKLRLQLEESGLATSWISERILRAGAKDCGGLKGRWVPDGIYETPLGQKVAFELEVSQKSREAYRTKIRSYANILKQSEDRLPFGKVHFVCARDSVLEILKTETRLYPDLFLIEPLSKYELLGKTNINNKKGN